MRLVIRCLTLVIVCSIAWSQGPKGAQPDGWFDMSGPHPLSRIVEIAGSGEVLAIAQTAERGGQIVVLSSDLQPRFRWTTPRKPKYLALSSQRVLVGYANDNGTFIACLHDMDGTSKADCIEGAGWPSCIVSWSDRFYAVDRNSISEIDFNEKKLVSRSATPAVGRDDQFIVGTAGHRLVRLDSISLRGRILDLESNHEQTISLVSPTLARHVQDRGKYEILVHSLFGSRNGGIVLVPARWNVFQGLLLERFDAEGNYQNSKLLAIPEFADMKKEATGGIGNPTGHLVVRTVLPALSRLFFVDFDKNRLVWFDIDRLEEK